ncbi:hypothetical protein D9M68_860940 [compost metagenome]
MGHQHQPEGEEQALCGVPGIGPPSSHQQGEQRGQGAEDEERMAEAPVVGHRRHRVGVVDHHVHIRQGAQQCAVEQRLAPLPAAEQRALDGGAEHRLGE